MTAFKGIREDKNTASQLKQDNKYSLTDNNQKRISKAIENLGANSGENNIKFLIDLGENLKYGCNIQSDAKPNNDWKLKIKNAIYNSLSISNPVLKEKYSSKINDVFSSHQKLSGDETEILKLKDELLKNIDFKQLEHQKNKNIKNVEKNLDAFISSSEVPITQKKYILNRFNYFLSPEYHINPQLEDKKTLVLAEMLNDIVINSHTSDIPNTKAINQKHHGMCAAISIARKLMSYEYKTDYVDTILSELDDSPNIMVYDLAHIGENKKIPVNKTYIDFNDALSKGYRIIDASTTQWMNIADMSGIDNKSELNYIAFDPAHFGTFADSHYQVPFENEFDSKQSYYQTLLKAKENINRAKAVTLEKNINYVNSSARFNNDVNLISDLHNEIYSKIKKILPAASKSEIHSITSNLLKLEKNFSVQINKMQSNLKPYSFIKNEESIVKENKIKLFFKDTYKDEIDETALESYAGDIRDLIEMNNSIAESVRPSKTLSNKIRKDRILFEAAAAYRTSMIMALHDDDMQTDFMIHYNIPDTESYLADTLQNYINKIKQGNKLYTEYFAKQFGIPEDKSQILEILNEVKNDYETVITENFDNLYNMLGINGRKGALINKIQYAKDCIENGDKSMLRSLSITIGMPKNKIKILDKLNEYQKILTTNPSEADYRIIYNKIGNKNQLADLAEAYKTALEALENPTEPEYEAILKEIKLANNIEENAPVSELNPVLSQFADTFNRISEGISVLRDSLVVSDEKQNILDSANPNFKIIKKMENEGRIIPTNELIKLQTRYNEIDKIRSEDEFSSRQGQISNPELYKYTNGEKATLKRIQNSLNQMYSNTNKELVQTYREIRKPLEEHARKIGVNIGMYWTPPEGSSGLFDAQQTKILQQLTDRPYHTITNIEQAVDKIKNGTHSGISSTSVFHDRSGWHAQYIAEIAEKDGKDIIFHDNTWGSSEHENVWRDSKGLLRTDYSDRRGGEYGYITDENWRNGSFVQYLTEKNGKIQPSNINSRMLKKLKDIDDERQFPLLADIILPGIDNEKTEDIVAMIKDNIFIPDSIYLNSLESMASNMTLDEIKARKIRIENAGKLYSKELAEINKRLEITPFRNEIKSKADFDALPDNDNLKVVFEKAALDSSYDYISLWKEFSNINSVSDLEKLKVKQKETARQNFNYAFSKSPEILLAYALNKHKNNLFGIINKALENNNIILSDEDKIKIITQTAVYTSKEKKLFDGSLKNTINFMVNKLMKQYDEIVPPSANAQKAKQEIKDNLTKDLEQALYFNQKDLLKDTDKHEAIKKYIDRKFNPETDEDFVKIYRKLQDMTTEEFNKITKDATYEDMAYKNYTGYDILVKYRASNPVIKQKIANLVYQKYLLNDLDLSNTSPSFQYKKLQKKVRGATYQKGRTFDDLYRSFSFSLSSLNYEKLFNKYKDDNYRKYKSMPAYPKIDISNEQTLQSKINLIKSYIEDSVDKINNKKSNLYIYNLTDKVDNILSGIADNQPLNEKQRRLLNSYTGEFVTENCNDKTIQSSINAAFSMLDFPPEATAGDYKKIFTKWKNEINAIRNINSDDDINKFIKSDIAELKEVLKSALITDIPPKYMNKVKKDLNEFLDEYQKINTAAYDNTLQARKLKSQISAYVQPNVTMKAQEDFYNTLVLLLQNVKKLRTEQHNIDLAKERDYTQLIASILEAEKAFKISVENSDKFIKEINALCYSDDDIDNTYLEAELKNTIHKYTDISKDNIPKIKEYNKIIDTIIKNNRLNLSQSEFKNLQKINHTITNFISTKIKPEYTNAVQEGIKDFIGAELASSQNGHHNTGKLENLEQKLINDYNRYNYMNHPEELLDRYVELCAKDGPLARAKTKDEKQTLTIEKQIKKDYLQTALSLASIIEMQELLMDAADLGNPALATYKFKNFSSGFFDEITGAETNLDDPAVINYMVRSLMLENDYSTAIMFVEKLGLTDKFLQIEDKKFDVEEYKKLVNKTASIIRTTNKQISILQEELSKINEETPDMMVQKIDKLKENYIKKTNNLNRKKNIKIILEALDNSKTIIAENPGISSRILLEETINRALAQISEMTNTDLREKQAELKQLKTICDMISQINVPEYREGFKYRQNILEKFRIIEDYNNDNFQQLMADSEYFQHK